MKVHLRQRKQTDKGRISLYLEIYKGKIKQPDGKYKNIRDYEYLDLSLIDNPRSVADRTKNREILSLAEGIRDKRALAIKSGLYGIENKTIQNANFIEYFQRIALNKIESKGNNGNWLSSYKHLVKYAGPVVMIKHVDEDFCKGYVNYLKSAKTKSGKNLSESAIASYYLKLRACLNHAVKDKLLLSSPAIFVEVPKVAQNRREYLTLEELRKLYKTDCRYEVLKRAFLFSALTGLRWSDVNLLTWDDLRQTNDGWQVVFNQRKTRGLQYQYISEQAMALMGEVKGKDDRVFTGLKYSDYFNVELSRWILEAGISKHITFHCARHTYAILQLDNGTDIVTLQELMGHKDLKTTLIYAKVMDAKKREAANKIPSLL